MFFGRSREREAVIDRLGTNLVYGGRQLGKTALLRDVERRYHSPGSGVVVRWIDLKTEGIGLNRPVNDLWAVMSAVLQKEGVAKSQAGTPATFTKHVATWLEQDHGRRIVLLLDEADVFLESDGKRQFENLLALKGLMDTTERRFKVVFAGLHNVQRTSRDVNTPLAHLGRPLCIGPLLEGGDSREALAMIREPLGTLGYAFETEDLLLRIVSHTNYYPSLTQLFCKHLLDHLTNPSACRFEIKDSPPFRITGKTLENAQTSDLREAILDRFRLTLDLDPRYRLIALCIALWSASRGDLTDRADGVDVSWVREEGLGWWAQGFASDSSLEAFRTILEEMIGLGLLRKTQDARYALRSANIVNLLGTHREIENALLDAAAKEPPAGYEPGSFRRALDGDLWNRSVLTAEQESDLLMEESGVRVVCGCPVAGVEDLPTSLITAAHPAPVTRLARGATYGEFMRLLADTAGNRIEGLQILLVPSDVVWTESWIVGASTVLSRKTSRKRFIRVVFSADPASLWTSSMEATARSDGQRVRLSLKPWSDATLRRWLDEAGVAVGDESARDEVSRITGNWPVLLRLFGSLCHASPFKWREHLQQVAAETDHGKCLQQFGVVTEAEDVLFTMATLGGALTREEVGMLLPGVAADHVSRVFKWADQLSLLKPRGQARWELDPVLRTCLHRRVS